MMQIKVVIFLYRVASSLMELKYLNSTRLFRSAPTKTIYLSEGCKL